MVDDNHRRMVENTYVDVGTAVSTLLRNAFVRALVPKLDQKISVKDVEQTKRRGEKSSRGERDSPKRRNSTD
jgi:hypothetical protein